MIAKLIKSMFLVTLYFMSQFFHIAIFHLHHKKIQLLLLIQLMMMELLAMLHHRLFPLISSCDSITHNLVDYSNDSLLDDTPISPHLFMDTPSNNSPSMAPSPQLDHSTNSPPIYEDTDSNTSSPIALGSIINNHS